MKLNEWSIVENIETKEREVVYGDLDDFIRDCLDEPVDKNKFISLPQEQWTTDEMTEIISNLLEDANRHSACQAPYTIKELMSQANIEDDKIKAFFNLYIKEMFDIYGY